MVRATLAISLALLGACSSDDPCSGVTGTCLSLPAGATAEEIQTALIEVPPGGTVAFGAGRFELEVDLSLDVDGVTIRGAGRDATTLSFAGQTTGGQGMLVTANAFTIQDIIAIYVFILGNITGLPFMTIYKGVVPFLSALVLALVIMFVFPDFATWLPNRLRGK